MAILDYTLEELHERLVNGELSSVQIIEAVYDKIDETEANVGAFLALNKKKKL